MCRLQNHHSQREHLNGILYVPSAEATEFPASGVMTDALTPRSRLLGSLGDIQLLTHDGYS
jgi:hypothetical protein